ncbi:MAG: hypothetical protein PVF68_13680 [Acidobacteriota bacterium]|jgi:hypothetical protein
MRRRAGIPRAAAFWLAALLILASVAGSVHYHPGAGQAGAAIRAQQGASSEPGAPCPACRAARHPAPEPGSPEWIAVRAAAAPFEPYVPTAILADAFRSPRSSRGPPAVA